MTEINPDISGHRVSAGTRIIQWRERTAFHEMLM
jgi:hypothetical protein